MRTTIADPAGLSFRRGWDSNPRTPVKMLLEFQSSAFDRSATSPIKDLRHYPRAIIATGGSRSRARDDIRRRAAPAPALAPQSSAAHRGTDRWACVAAAPV